jgi:hypothetical protein
MTQFPDLFAALAAPFEPREVKLRASQGGRPVQYITARTAMNRLDSVLGPENWWDEYVPSENSVLCKLTLRLPDGSTVTKCDAGGYAGLADSGDDDKSGVSDAFKRAAAKFGVARYLYKDGVPAFVREREPGVDAAPGPAVSFEAEPVPSPMSEHRPAGAPPRTGRALFAWTKEQDVRRHAGAGLLKYLSRWAKRQDFPSRMIDWDADQVALAYNEACRKLAAHEPASRDAYEQALAN